MKNKLTTIGIILVTVILAGVAIFTAYKLYQTRNTAIAPNVPSSKPKAAGEVCGGIQGIACPAGEQCVYEGGAIVAPNPDATGTCEVVTGDHTAPLCQLSFTLATSTPTATPSHSPSPSPSPSPVPLCNS